MRHNLGSHPLYITVSWNKSATFLHRRCKRGSREELVSQESALALDLFPAFSGQKRFSSLRHGCLFCEPAVQATCEDQRDMKPSTSNSAYSVPTNIHIRFACDLQINPVCSPGLRNRHRVVWCQSGLAGLQCHSVGFNLQGTSAVLYFNCKAFWRTCSSSKQIVSISLSCAASNSHRLLGRM